MKIKDEKKNEYLNILRIFDITINLIITKKSIIFKYLYIYIPSSPFMLILGHYC